MLDEVAEGAERLVRLVENLMLLVRIDSGVIRMEVSRYGVKVNMASLIRRVAEAFQPIAAIRNVDVDLEISGEPVVLGMKNYLENVMKNLVDNSIKFCKHGRGHVQIKLGTEGDQAVISISDDGIGIASSDFERIFVRFEQINRHELEQQGVGLGLTLAKNLIEFHGGSIDLESKVDHGSTFCVRLPLMENSS